MDVAAPRFPTDIDDRGTSGLPWTGALVALGAAGLAAQSAALGYLYWPDEYESIVTGRMMAAGASLYDEVFTQEGPLHLVLAGWIAGTGAGLAGFRIVVAAAQWAILAAVLFASLRLTPRERAVFGAFAAAWMFYALPEVKGHTYLYETFGGILAALVLALHVVPVLGGGRAPGPLRTAAAGVAIGMLPFLAFIYGPPALAFWLAGLRRDTVVASTLGAAAGAVLAVALLAAEGSVPGYLAYHYYLNLVVYPAAVPAGAATTDWAGATLRETAVAVVTVAVLLLAAGTAVARRTASGWRAALLVAGVGFLMLRGPHYSIPAFYTVPALLLLAGGPVRRVTDAAPAAAWAAVAAGVVATLHFQLWDRDRLALLAVPQTTPFAELARANTEPGETILAWPYKPADYVLADRLPASKHHFYLPQQAAYNGRPVLGTAADPCVDLRLNRPRLVLVDPAPVWGAVRFSDYGRCVEDVLAESYRPAPIDNAFELN